MRLDLNDCLIDERRVRDGVWWHVHRNDDGTVGGVPVAEPGDKPALLIRPLGPDFQRALEDEQRPHLVEIREKRLPDAVGRRLLSRALARTVWVGCINITVGKEPFVWSETAAARFLEQIAADNWRDFIFRVAQDRAALAAEEEGKAAGN